MKYLIDKETLTSIANSIRAKKGTTDKIKAEDFATEIGAIPVPTPPNLQDKSIEITQNGAQTISADEGYDGLNILEITTNVSGGDTPSPSFTGHYDKVGLMTKLGWSEEDVNYYQQNGVNWNHENDDIFTISDEDVANSNTSNARFLNANSTTTNFQNYKFLIAIPKINLGSKTGVSNIFSSCYALITIPQIDTSKVTVMSNMFYDCHALISIPQLNTNKVVTTSKMFYDCYNLREIPQLETGNVTDMSSMFYNCYNLKKIPELNTSLVKNISSMFYNCYQLTEIPELNTESATNVSYMFYGCRQLRYIPKINISLATTTADMFRDCYSLITIPELDTIKVTSMNDMFYNCYSLKEIPQLNTEKVNYMGSMFYNCYQLKEIPELDASHCGRVDSMFSNCYALKIINGLGLKYLGQTYSTSQSSGYSQYTLTLSSCTLLTHDSLMNVINGLYDIATKGCKAQKLVLGNTNLNKLTDEEKAIATTKGWTLS